MKHIEPSEINIINYLSGEMSKEDLKQFELQLQENQLLRTQIEEMRLTQEQIGVWGDDNIQIPAFEPLNTANTANAVLDENKTGNRRFLLPNWLKYAAAFIGFALLMQIMGFKVNHNGNTLMLSFGEPTSNGLNAQDVDDIVATAISTYAKDQNNQLAILKNQLNTDLANITAAVDNISVKHDANLSQLENMVGRNMDGQYVRLESMIRGIEDNQRQELEDSVTGFMEYMESKRIKDQYKIQNAFSEIATAINNQHNQTNALLTSLSDEDPGLKSY